MPIKKENLIDILSSKPTGLWRVTTRSFASAKGGLIRDFGFWNGHIADIAFHLAEKAYFSLHFEPVILTSGEVNNPEKATGDTVNITFGVKPGTWYIVDSNRIIVLSDFLNRDNHFNRIEISNTSYFSTIFNAALRADRSAEWYNGGISND